MNDDGTMARVPDLIEFAQQHDMKLVSIEALISYRMRSEMLVEKTAQADFPAEYGHFTLHAYEEQLSNEVHVALTMGEWDPEEPVLVRVHSQCLTGDTLGSLRCDCGRQLERALQNIGDEGQGVLLYMRHEGRGIGLSNKLRAYALQDEGLDTVEANEALGFPADARDYGTGCQILADLGVRKLRLMTNNPRKRTALAGYGLEIVERVPIVIESNPANERYLTTKKTKLGHLF
jgi:3,4-dihydroxy 2-butanone 4-phosphate synthase/GTP cyclohydrolase II